MGKNQVESIMSGCIVPSTLLECRSGGSVAISLEVKRLVTAAGGNRLAVYAIGRNYLEEPKFFFLRDFWPAEDTRAFIFAGGMMTGKMCFTEHGSTRLLVPDYGNGRVQEIDVWKCELVGYLFETEKWFFPHAVAASANYIAVSSSEMRTLKDTRSHYILLADALTRQKIKKIATRPGPESINLCLFTDPHSGGAECVVIVDEKSESLMVYRAEDGLFMRRCPCPGIKPYDISDVGCGWLIVGQKGDVRILLKDGTTMCTVSQPKGARKPLSVVLVDDPCKKFTCIVCESSRLYALR